jgi:sugar O-acyltransferase (sialic acid O-acetyltransferase NeuD family)
MMQFLIIGAGQVGRLVAEIARRIPDLECVGFLDRNPSLQGQRIFGIPVLGEDSRLEEFAGKVEGALPVLGDLRARLELFSECRRLGFRLVNVIDPSVNIASDVKLGEGIVISCGTILLTGVEVKDYAFVGTGVRILHDTVIGSNCIIGGGSTIGASVTVESNVSFGVGVQVASGRKRIGENASVGAGSVVLKDVPKNVFVLGNPARAIGAHDPFAVAEQLG